VVKITLDAETFRALASTTRLTVLRALDERRKTLTELSRDLALNKATVHEHLQLLTSADLIRKRDDEGRKWIYYELTWRGQRLLHPQETTTFNVLLGLGVLAAGGGVAMLGRALGWWLQTHPVVTRHEELAGSSDLDGDGRVDGANLNWTVLDSPASDGSARLSDSYGTTGTTTSSTAAPSSTSEAQASSTSSPPSGTGSDGGGSTSSSPPDSSSGAPAPQGGSGGSGGTTTSSSPPPETASSTAPPSSGTPPPEAPQYNGANDFVDVQFSDHEQKVNVTALEPGSQPSTTAAPAAAEAHEFFGEGGWLAIALMVLTAIILGLALLLRRQFRPGRFDAKSAAAAKDQEPPVAFQKQERE
jgi:DNA-binding transcriptional ArsR family regulator